MAALRVYCRYHRRVEEQVSLQNATTMRYAALHVAEACGFDPAGVDWLLTTKAGQPIPGDDLAADWDGQEVVLSSHEGTG